MAHRLSKPVKRACKVASVNHHIPQTSIETAFYCYYKMIAEDIKKMDKNDPDSFLNYNLPGVGKLFCKPERVEKLIKLANARKLNDETQRD